MKNRYLVAAVLLSAVAAVVIFELFYLHSSAEILSDGINRTIELTADGKTEEARNAFEAFRNEYFRRENMMSLFIHDSMIEEIHALTDETEGLFKTGETGEIGGVLENLNGKIRDFYLSMLPNIRNLM